MMEERPRALGEPPGSALIRCRPEDFRVTEELGFEPDGSGEHVFLHLRKSRLNTRDLMKQVSRLSEIPERDIGYSGLKDRNAVTLQWLSVRMAGRPEPDWQGLAELGGVEVLAVSRHGRKLKRGVHRANRFTLVLRQVRGERGALESRLEQIRDGGVPNYFGEQRFGRNDATLARARAWMGGGRRPGRHQRGLYLSALRSLVFNRLLAARVKAGDWNRLRPGDVCMLQGSRSFFRSEAVDDSLAQRLASGDVHPGLPLWGRTSDRDGTPALEVAGLVDEWREECRDVCAFLEREKLDLAWRPTRLLPDDFCWQFCDDDSLQLDFELGAGSYATALLAEFVQYKEGTSESGIGSEQG